MSFALLIEVGRLVCDKRLLQQLLIDLLATCLNVGARDASRVDHQLTAATIPLRRLWSRLVAIVAKAYRIVYGLWSRARSSSLGLTDIGGNRLPRKHT